MELGTPVVTPPNIPEFGSLEGNLSFNKIEPISIMECILAALNEKQKTVYPVSRHYPSYVARQTVEAYLNWLDIKLN